MSPQGVSEDHQRLFSGTPMMTPLNLTLIWNVITHPCTYDPKCTLSRVAWPWRRPLPSFTHSTLSRPSCSSMTAPLESLLFHKSGGTGASGVGWARDSCPRLDSPFRRAACGSQHMNSPNTSSCKSHPRLTKKRRTPFSFPPYPPSWATWPRPSSKCRARS